MLQLFFLPPSQFNKIAIIQILHRDSKVILRAFAWSDQITNCSGNAMPVKVVPSPPAINGQFNQGNWFNIGPKGSRRVKGFIGYWDGVEVCHKTTEIETVKIMVGSPLCNRTIDDDGGDGQIGKQKQ